MTLDDYSNLLAFLRLNIPRISNDLTGDEDIEPLNTKMFCVAKASK